ncbi:conserved protein of unknown function [Methylacidimicrobium sp. AP8]|nr:conserved protein of unknown function [Methylacidimicrobium sp. AP8]
MESFELIPIDTLFVRDGRPLAAGGFYGRGARWPSPPTLFGALRTALLERAGTLPAGRSLPGARRGGVPRGRIGTAAFQWLRIQGPFPVLGEKVYFPRPADLVADLDAGFLEPLRPFPVPVIWRQSNLPSPLSNLPSPLTYAVGVGGRPGKEEQPVRWVERAFLEKYLAGAEKLRRPEHVEIWDAEPRIGVAIEALTQAAKEGQLYLAEHLRLREGVRLRFAAGDRPTHKAPDPQEAGLGVGSLLGGDDPAGERGASSG